MTTKSQGRKTSSPGLTREAIVAAGVRIADAEGIAALSMRRMATELDSGVMSLYRHVANKDALLTAITRVACDENPYPTPPPPNWRDAMRVAAELDWEVYRRHPWALVTSSSARHFSDTSCLDWMTAVLKELTDDTALAHSLAIAVWSYVQGASIQRVAQQLLPGDDAPAQSPLTATEEDFTVGLETLLDGIERRCRAARGVSGTGGEECPASIMVVDTA
ncbi:TetR/AcrR family transcriptional regulator [Streptomyces liangshanensis]|uniref:TetR/AcrR family transcriptional regulator n=1 Tax=Streptomyces liangshanensis TaxID=2717324 RepID=A0A6G9H788_9ACTN|nr:TetR/AcrR family transcriptional regulator [Streptomyces liangshanensis]QIQ05967.1 TetR/AcrR family transcriptional regulator [Streptomyces liangshanensis]